jgi:hypothetical protein
MVRVTVDVPRERVSEVVKHLNKLDDIRVDVEQTGSAPPPSTRKKWAGAIKNPSQELLEYADKVREEWNHRI